MKPKKLIKELIRTTNIDLSSSSNTSVSYKAAIFVFLSEQGYKQNDIAEIIGMSRTTMIHYKKNIDMLKSMDFYKCMFILRMIWITIDMKYIELYKGFDIYFDGLHFITFPKDIEITNFKDSMIESLFFDKSIKTTTLNEAKYSIEAFYYGFNLCKTIMT